MNKVKLLDKLSVELSPSVDYNLSKKNGKYIISTEEEVSTKSPKWAQELILEVRTGFKQVNSRLDALEQDVTELKRDMTLIKSLPTIQKEIKELSK